MNRYEAPKTPVKDTGSRNGKLTPTVCTHCGHRFDGVAEKTFLGFQKFNCEQCHQDFSSVLFPGYRITYWVLLVLSAIAVLTMRGAQPSIFVILMGIAVSIDAYRLWKRPR